MVEVKVAEILHNFYEAYPYMSSDRMNTLYESIRDLKEDVYFKAKNFLIKHNLSLILTLEDIDTLLMHRATSGSRSNELDRLTESQLCELFELISDREYVKTIYKHLMSLNGLKAITQKISKELA